MKPIVLVILDGFGIAPSGPGNAIAAAHTPHLDMWFAKYPYAELDASGRSVGLPEGTQGTSEAGHITIGAGRIVNQPSVAIDQAIRDGSFFENSVLVDAMKRARRKDRTLHLMGLFSNAGVHAKTDHLYALIDMAKQSKVGRVALHLFLDGRDVPEKSALEFIKDLGQHTDERVFVASLVGRYFAMDRDSNYERTQRAFELITHGKGHAVSSVEEGIRAAYARGDRSDYYVDPTVVVDEDNLPLATVGDDDVVIYYNFRADRARQLTHMFLERRPAVHFVCMSTYDASFEAPSAYPQETVKNNLAHVLADNWLRQFRCAETEKYAHVTYFFNSQTEELVDGEDRVMVDSPKVPSYDAKPEMSAHGVTAAVIDAVSSGTFDFLAVNFANTDLVGHSANYEATVKAVEVVDACLGEIEQAVKKSGSVLLITGDHGNAEMMIDESGNPNPSHSHNRVPFVIVSDEYVDKKLSSGGLADIAPTVLSLMNIEKPAEMTGRNLLT